jgi:protein-glutamine gamma-glutamyltransferase
MTFETSFRLISYASVLCGFLALWVSGTFGLAAAIAFLFVMAAAWRLEGSRWQISERWGTAMIVAALPVFYLLWRYGFFRFADSGQMIAGVLGRMILSLSAIKLLQRKSDRDWIFLYLMSFFEVLLAAGLSISALYFASFILYAFVMVLAIILFEVRKAGRTAAKDDTVRPRLKMLKLSAASIVLLLLTALVAVPVFFFLPRVGAAGGGPQGGVSASSGFSDTVRLGAIGTIQQNDQVVMRVRIEGNDGTAVGLRWRGVALDTFDNRSWSRTRAGREPRTETERGVVQVDHPSNTGSLTVQTVYLEPLDTPVLFALPRAIGFQGNFPVLYRDRHGSITSNRVGDRLSYKVLSDRSTPDEATLRRDRSPYKGDIGNYLQLPEDLDPRIAELAEQLTAGIRNRYDTASAIEFYLQNEFGYTLEMKASGTQPLASFLFDVREGHCEYFATAMAVMLRTQGIATRVVNGFSQGEYNDTAGVWVVRQKNAHSWVEVYFPGEDAWVSFDPTPFSGQLPGEAADGISAAIQKYMEALETFWIQYFVAFDNQEQRSLFASIRRGFDGSHSAVSSFIETIGDRFSEWWREAAGEMGPERRWGAVARAGIGIVVLAAVACLFVWARRRIVRSEVWLRFRKNGRSTQENAAVVFYERMLRILAEQGMVRAPHQTPLEFAAAVGMPQAVIVTEKYNQVRFGEKDLTSDEFERVERLLEELGPADR